MKTHTTIFIIALAFSPHALSAWRCDCSIKMGPCEAKISKTGNFIHIGTDVSQCSQVVWYADGHPHSTTVLDMKNSEEWLGPSEHPKLSVSSCTICQDSNYGSSESPEGRTAYNIIDISGNWSFRFSLPECSTCKSAGAANFITNGRSVSGEMHIKSLFFGSTDTISGEYVSANTVKFVQSRGGKRFDPYKCSINNTSTQIVCNYKEIFGQPGILVFDRSSSGVAR